MSQASARHARPEAPGLTLVLLALTPFGLGYFLSYLYRATNAVVAPDLVRDVGLSAGELGLLTAAYLLTFALFQIPLGILLDRYGPRRVQAVLVALGGLGALLFAVGKDGTTLLVARAIIGLGFSGGLMGSFKAVVIWVSEPRRPLANALVMSAGAIGLLVATTPLEFAVQMVGWRTAFWWLGMLTLAVAATIFLVVPERQGVAARRAPLRTEVAEMWSIMRDRTFLALAPLLALASAVHIAIQTLWAGPWFRDVAGLDRVAAADRLFIMAAAFFVGILLTGTVADRLSRRGVSLLHVILGFLAVFLASQVGIILDIRPLQIPLWVLFAMTGQVTVLAFPWFASYYGAHLSARANSGLNLPMFLLAFIFQTACGAVIDLFPSPTPGHYAPQAYATAFGLLLAIQLLALVWYLANWRRLAAADAIVRKAYDRRP
ncbi:MAG: MFS transporter [Hyphomicrobiaceae bacterium]